MRWTVETLNETADAEVEALPEDMRARLARIAKLIEDKGLERVGEPRVKHVEGRLWEMRLKGRRGISRALYVTAVGRCGLVTREIGSMMEMEQWHALLTCTRNG